MADRYLLLPSAGLMVIVADLLHRYRHKKISLLLGTIVALAWGTWTHKRIPMWHSSDAIWTDVTRKQPLEPRGWAARAGLHTDRGDFDIAEKLLNKGLHLLPDHPELLQGLGLLYTKQAIQNNETNDVYIDQITKAERFLRGALRGDPDLRKSANNLSVLLKRSKRTDEALVVAEQMVLDHPLYATGWNTLASIHLDSENPERAEAPLKRALNISPEMKTTLNNMGNLAYLQGDCTRAKKWWRKVLVNAPENKHATAGLLACQGK